MSKFYFPALFLCSLVLGGVFFVSLGRLPPSGPGRLEGYAALGLGAEVPDREAAGALEAALGRPVVSASSQWVLLNTFEGLERVPLEDYEDRLEPFDPRRDGYAEKLMNFFVRDGRRWFFIPLDRKLVGPLPSLNPGDRLKKRVAAALAALPGSPASGSPVSGSPVSVSSPVSPAASENFSLLMESPGRPGGLRILLFALAWAAAFLFSPGRLRPNRTWTDRPQSGGPRIDEGRRVRSFFRGLPGGPEGRRLLLLAPPMLPLSLWGPPGFAFIALFLFLASLLADPLTEWWIRRLGRKAFRRRGPYGSRFLYGLPLVLLLVFIPWLGAMPPLWVSLNFLGLVLIYCLSLGIEIRRKFPPARDGKAPYGPCRFVPLPILSPRFSALPAGSVRLPPKLVFPSGRRTWGDLVLPFALASCLAAFLGGPASSPDWPFLVKEEDYRAHALFQAGFTRRSLQFPDSGEPAAPGVTRILAAGEPVAPAAVEPGYFRYTLGEDGLVAGFLPLSPEGPEIPPFPLADLTDHLAAWGTGGAAESRGMRASLRPSLPLADLVFPLLAFLLVFPALAGGGRGWKRVSPYDEKRIAA